MTGCSPAASTVLANDAATDIPDVGVSDTSDTMVDASGEAALAEGGDDGSASDGADANASVDANANSTADAGPCTGHLFDIGSVCAATYVAALAAVQCGEYAYTGVCDGFARVGYTDGNTAIETVEGWVTCIYDGVGAGTLVGTYRSSDTNLYCNDTSSDIRAGQVPGSCTGMPLAVGDSGTLHTSCDSGVDQ